MPHVIEPASTGRAQCRACGRKIERGELRFGEKRENTFGEGESTLWFHPQCAAYARPDQLLELLNEQTIEGAEPLRPIAEAGREHPKLPQVKGAERSPTGRASCRHCHRPIAKDAWRVALMFFEEFRFDARGYIHAECTRDYFGTTDIIDRIKHFSPEIPANELEDLSRALTQTAGS